MNNKNEKIRARVLSQILLSGLIIGLFFSQPIQAQKKASLKWKFKTQGKIFSTPTVYQQTVYIGSNDGHLYALDERTGKLRWKFKTNGKVNSGVGVADGIAYVQSTDGYCYAVQTDKGVLKWKFRTNGENKHDAWDYCLSTPAVDNQRVYFGSGDYNIYALDKNTGKEAWRYTTGDIVRASPLLKFGKLYIGGFDGYFYALDPNTGRLEWKFKTVGNGYFRKGAIQGSAGVLDLKASGVRTANLYFGSRDYNLYAVDAFTGTGVWNERSPSWVIARPLVDGNTVYFGNSDRPAFFAHDARGGRQKWKSETNLNVFSTAVAGRKSIYFGSFNGQIYALDKKTGKQQVVFRTDGSRRNYQKVFGDDDKVKKSLLQNVRTLKQVADLYDTYHSLGSIVGELVIQNDTLYFGSTDGQVYAVGLDEKK